MCVNYEVKRLIVNIILWRTAIFLKSKITNVTVRRTVFETSRLHHSDVITNKVCFMNIKTSTSPQLNTQGS